MESYIDALFSNDTGMGFVIGWSDETKGFGQITFRQDSNDKQLSIDSECMGREFVKKILCSLVDKSTLEYD